MTAPAVATDGITLSLQSLIDRRYDVLGFRESAHVTGSDFPGHRIGAKRGQGIEFLDLRPYTPGDDVRHIDWNVTARSTEPYTRLYQQEKELTTTVLVDMRPVMFNGSDRLRAVAAGHLAATTLWQSAKAGDRCTALVIDVDKISVSRPLTGKKGVLPALELIAAGFTTSNTVVHRAGQRTAKRSKQERRSAPQLSDAFDTINKNRHHSGQIVMFSGFDTEGDDDYDKALLALASRGSVTAALLLDKIEQQPLPAGTYYYRYLGKSNRVSIDRKIGDNLAAKLVEQQTVRQQRLKTAGIKTMAIESPCTPLRFLSALHQRGWL